MGLGTQRSDVQRLRREPGLRMEGIEPAANKTQINRADMDIDNPRTKLTGLLSLFARLNIGAALLRQIL